MLFQQCEDIIDFVNFNFPNICIYRIFSVTKEKKHTYFAALVKTCELEEGEMEEELLKNLRTNHIEICKNSRSQSTFFLLFPRFLDFFFGSLLLYKCYLLLWQWSSSVSVFTFKGWWWPFKII